MGDRVEVARIPDCDICANDPIGKPRRTPAIVDGKTVHGPWANMCEQHFDQYGVGLGTGRGQRLVLRGSPAESTTGPMAGQT